jgi:pimeloyl-ACP methyl ester carboxylesterase
MLLHGGMAHSGWWETLAPELTPCCRPFAFDRRGHGESEWADPDAVRLDRDIADIETVMARLDPGPWILVGHSQGGLLAAEVATAGRARLAGMVLVDVPLEPRSPDLRRTGRALRRMPQIHYPTIEDAVRRFQPFPPKHRIPDDELRRLAAESFRSDTRRPLHLALSLAALPGRRRAGGRASARRLRGAPRSHRGADVDPPRRRIDDPLETITMPR